VSRLSYAQLNSDYKEWPYQRRFLALAPGAVVGFGIISFLNLAPLGTAGSAAAAAAIVAACGFISIVIVWLLWSWRTAG
jgi:hypothetical protein